MRLRQRQLQIQAWRRRPSPTSRSRVARVKTWQVCVEGDAALTNSRYLSAVKAPVSQHNDYHPAAAMCVFLSSGMVGEPEESWATSATLEARASRLDSTNSFAKHPTISTTETTTATRSFCYTSLFSAQGSSLSLLYCRVDVVVGDQRRPTELEYK